MERNTMSFRSPHPDLEIPEIALPGIVAAPLMDPTDSVAGTLLTLPSR